MVSARSVYLLTVICMIALSSFSCGEKQQEESESPASEEQAGTISYVSEDFSFGVFFDAEGTKRTIELEKGQKELQAYVMVHVPDSLEIAAVQWKLDLPEGLEVGLDKYNKRRVLTLGQMEGGISERFKPCLKGPRILIHELTLIVTGELKDAMISVLPSPDGNFLGIARCEKGFDLERASSYRAVVNPE